MSLFGKGGIIESMLGETGEKGNPTEKSTTLLGVVSTQEAKRRQEKDEKTLVIGTDGKVHTVAEEKGTAKEYPAEFFDPSVKIPPRTQ